MMDTSSRHQKQKLTLSKPHHLARSIVRQFIPLPASPLKRLGLVGAGLLTGVGLPALVFAASQQHQASTAKVEVTGSSTVTVHSTASSQAEGAASLQGLGADKKEQQKPGDTEPDAHVVINGEEVPLVNGAVSEQLKNDDGSHVDINVTIDHTTTSESSSNFTDISIDSSSSTTDNQNTTRGSPRR